MRKTLLNFIDIWSDTLKASSSIIIVSLVSIMNYRSKQYIYLITSLLRNIASQLQCISESAAGTSAIPVTDKQYFSVAM